MSKKGGLGRGLGALIPTSAPEASPATAPASPAAPAQLTPVSPLGAAVEPLPVAGASFHEIPIAAITPNPKQPRLEFDPDALEELMASIKEVGVLQPIVVRPLGGERYELIMGERRLRACTALGMTAVPAIVRDTADEVMLRDALLENLHRQQLNPLEEGAAYQQLLEEFGVTQEQLATRIGRSRPQISNTIRLLQLPAPVQRRVAAGVLSAGHARALLSLAEAAEQEALATRIVAEGLSVRAVEEIVALGEKTKAPRAARAPRVTRPELAELSTRLSDRFDTRVRVDMGPRADSKGKITLEFAGQDDLERILGLIDQHRAPHSP